MSLNGLDAAPVQEAYQAALAEAGGWFLLKYITRDEVDLFGTGTGGLLELKTAATRYDEAKPLYGLLSYRRKRVIVNYIPEGTSRLLQVRGKVHFQSITEEFGPADTVLEASSPSDLNDTTLNDIFPLHTATPAAAKKLSGITELREDLRLSTLQSAVNSSPSSPSPATTINEASKTPTSPIRDPSRVKPEPIPESTPAPVNKPTSSVPAAIKALPPLKTDALHETVRPTTPANRSRTSSDVETYTPKAAPPISPFDHTRSPSSASSGIVPYTITEIVGGPNPNEQSSRSSTPFRRPESPFKRLESPFRDESARSPAHPVRSNTSEHTAAEFFGLKTKVKLGPRPSMNTPSTSHDGSVKSVSTLPMGLRLWPRRERSRSRSNVSEESRAPITIPPPPPIPDFPDVPLPPTRPASRGSMKSSKSMPANGKTPVSAEKRRLMKALELRKKQQQQQQTQQNGKASEPRSNSRTSSRTDGRAQTPAPSIRDIWKQSHSPESLLSQAVVITQSVTVNLAPPSQPAAPQEQPRYSGEDKADSGIDIERDSADTDTTTTPKALEPVSHPLPPVEPVVPPVEPEKTILRPRNDAIEQATRKLEGLDPEIAKPSEKPRRRGTKSKDKSAKKSTEPVAEASSEEVSPVAQKQTKAEKTSTEFVSNDQSPTKVARKPVAEPSQSPDQNSRSTSQSVTVEHAEKVMDDPGAQSEGSIKDDESPQKATTTTTPSNVTNATASKPAELRKSSKSKTASVAAAATTTKLDTKAAADLDAESPNELAGYLTPTPETPKAKQQIDFTTSLPRSDSLRKPKAKPTPKSTAKEAAIPEDADNSIRHTLFMSPADNNNNGSREDDRLRAEMVADGYQGLGIRGSDYDLPNHSFSIKRRGLVQPIDVSGEGSDEEYLSDDSLMEELKSAEVHEARSMSVNKTPATPIFARSTSAVSTSTRENESLHRDSTDVAAASYQDRLEGQARKTSADSDRNANTGESLIARRTNVSTGISNRIAALAERTSTIPSPESGPSSFLAVRRASGRKVFSIAPTSPTATSPPPPHFSRPGTAVSTQTERPPTTLYNRTSPKPARPESISVTARIIRSDDDTPDTTADNGYGNQLHKSPLIIEHQRADETSPTFRELRSASNRPANPLSSPSSISVTQSLTSPILSTKQSIEKGLSRISRFSRASRSPSVPTVPTTVPTTPTPDEQQPRTSTSSAPSWRPSSRSTTHRRNKSNPYTAPSPRKPRSSHKPSSIMTDTSSMDNYSSRPATSHSNADTIGSTKRDSKRTTRIFQRMSSSLSLLGHRRSNSNIGQHSRGLESRADTISDALDESEEPYSPKPSFQPVPLGDLNVQFPDTLLWKRRWVVISSAGDLIMSIAPNDGRGYGTERARGGIKRYALSEFRAPAIPDQDREELPYSIILDFADGGAGVQLACGDGPSQGQLLIALAEAHRVWA